MYMLSNKNKTMSLDHEPFTHANIPTMYATGPLSLTPERVNYSYLLDNPKAPVQIYGEAANGDHYGAEGLAGEPGLEHVEVIPRLTVEDGLVVGDDGKLHFVGNHLPADRSDRFDEITGHFRSSANAARGSLALRAEIAAPQQGRIYRVGDSHRRPYASHRAE